MTDRYERTRDPAEGEGRAITAAKVTLFGRECFVPADIAQEVEQACAAHDLADGEEIMVNAAHDVYTLPLHPSGLSSGPRFVVHVPGPEQPAAVDGLAARLVDELDGLVSESGGVSGLHLNGDVATWEELLPGGRFERLSSLDELREALAAAQQQQPAAVFRNDGNTEADFIAHEANACTACGGSGHKADQQPEAQAVAWELLYPDGSVAATEPTAIKALARINGYKPTLEALLAYEEMGYRLRPAYPTTTQQPAAVAGLVENAYAGCTIWRGSLRVSVTETEAIEHCKYADEAFCDLVQRALDSLAAAWDAAALAAQQQGGSDDA